MIEFERIDDLHIFLSQDYLFHREMAIIHLV